MDKIKKTRNPGMDIIRCVALFFVISTHFFAHIGFYEETIAGPRMYIMLLLRTFFMICVPLFLMLSGYLMKNRKPELVYYIKIIKTLSIYVLASLACIAFRILVLKEPYTLKTAIAGIMNFSVAPYGWYIEMYLGLFCLIPFLNILYNNIDTKKKKQGLILVLLLLTAAPGLHPLISDWWEVVYPITYYFLGCYLREYPLKIKLRTNLLFIVLVFLIAGSFSFYHSQGGLFVWSDLQGFGSIANVVQGTLIFNFFAQLKYNKISAKAGKLLAHLSDWCLGAYLVSWIFDRVFYKILNDHQPIMQKRLVYFILIVPVIYICSLGLSAVINLIYKLCRRIVKKCFSH